MNAATSALLTKNRSHLGLRKMTTSFFVHREATRCKSAPTSFRGKSIIFGFQNISRVVCSFPSLFDITSFSSQVRKSCFISIGNKSPAFSLVRMLWRHFDKVSTCHQKKWCQNPSLYGREIPGTWLAILLLYVRLVVWIFTPFQRPKIVYRSFYHFFLRDDTLWVLEQNNAGNLQNLMTSSTKCFPFYLELVKVQNSY